MEIYIELTKRQLRLMNEEIVDIFQGIPHGVSINNKMGSRACIIDFDDTILEDVHDWLEANQMSFQMDHFNPEDLSEEAQDFLKGNRRF
jgi:hypothetical protein